MKSVFSSLCIFLALLATAAEAVTARTAITLTQDVTFIGVTEAQWTGDLKLAYERGYYSANGYNNNDDTALATGITATTTAVDAADPANVKVTFVVIQGTTFAGEAVTVTTLATSSTADRLVTAITAVKNAGAAADPVVFAGLRLPTAAQITVVPATKSTPADDGASSASGTRQFSQIALSIPVVAMVISKMC